MDKSSSEVVVNIAVDYWKLMRAFERFLGQLPAEKARRAESQLRFAAGRLKINLDAAGLSLAVFDGRALDATIPASAINADDALESAIITETLEPAVLAGSQVLRAARVVVATPSHGEKE